MPNKNRVEALEAILKITKKYNWGENERYQLNQILKNYGQEEFNSALVVKDVELINKLEDVVVAKAWKLTFNHDIEDGFWAEVSAGYCRDYERVADLVDNTRRDTLRAAILAAIEYFNFYVKTP